MGGQACVFYGAAEFSRDTDFAIAIDSDNWARLHRALDALQAKVIAVPPMSREHLDRGHAIHFRCHHPEASGLKAELKRLPTTLILSMLQPDHFREWLKY